MMKKVSETCYPPSLFRNNLPDTVLEGVYPRAETPVTPDVLDAGDVVEGVGG